MSWALIVGRGLAPAEILPTVTVPFAKSTVLKIKENKSACAVIDVVEPIFIVLLLTVITACLVNGSFNPFLYFRF